MNNHSNNTTWHPHKISKADREKIKNQKGICLWFTGFSGSGKSTIAGGTEQILYKKGYHTYVLDGDNIRHGLNRDLDFSAKGRRENIRRVGEVSKLFIDAGIILLTAFISPFKEDRDNVRKILGDNFIEIYVKCALEDCIKRDPKGLYKKALANEIPEFTGISSPYEVPEKPEIILDNSGDVTIKENIDIVIQYLRNKEIVRFED